MSGSQGDSAGPVGRRRLWGAARVLIGVVAIYLISLRVDLRQSVPTLRASDFGGIAFASSLLVLAQAASALRWKILIGRDAPPLSFLWRLYSIGSFFSLFLPTSIGGDAVRASAAIHAIPDKKRVVASVLIDRILGLIALMLFFGFGLLVAPRSITSKFQLGDLGSGGEEPIMVTLGVVAVALLLLTQLNSRLKAVALKGYEAVRSLADGPQQLLLALSVGIAVQGLYLSSWLVLARLFVPDLPFSGLLLGVPTVSLAAMIPVTIGGLGLREGAWGVIFSLFALPAASGVFLGLSYFLCVLLVGALGGGAFILLGTELRASAEPHSTRS